MINGDKVRFSEIMIGLAENYSSAQLTPIGLQLRFDAMKEFSIEQISEAATRLIKTRKINSMPTIAEIIELIPGSPALAMSAKSQAEIQADLILQHLRTYGSTRKPTLDDPISKNLMTVRWPYVSWSGSVFESDLKWWRKEFVDAYQAYSERDKVAALSFGGDNQCLLDIAKGATKAL